MSLASDLTAYGMATGVATPGGTSTLLFGATGLLAEVVPPDSQFSQLTLIPVGASSTYLHVGTASATTAIIPWGGLTIDAPQSPLYGALELFAAASSAIHVILGGVGARFTSGGIAR